MYDHIGKISRLGSKAGLRPPVCVDVVGGTVDCSKYCFHCLNKTPEVGHMKIRLQDDSWSQWVCLCERHLHEEARALPPNWSEERQFDESALGIAAMHTIMRK